MFFPARSHSLGPGNPTREAGGVTIWRAGVAQTVRRGLARYFWMLRKWPSSLGIEALACVLLADTLGEGLR